ncbi:MAG: ATP-binding protein [Xanthobacteraceae bacterium]
MRRRAFIRAIVGSGTKAGIIFCLMALFACQVALAAEHKRVMLLDSFGQDFKPWSEYAKDIRAEVNRQSPWPLDIIENSLITARFSDENPEAPFVEYLSALFATHPLDLIVSIGAPAADFVQRHRQRLFPTTPMVFTAVDQRRVQYSKLTENDVAVAVNINYLSAFENILQVLPDTKDVIVVVGTSPIEKFWKEAIGKQLEPLANRIKLSWTDELPFENLLKKASALPPHTAIFWELMIVDAAGIVHEGDLPLKRLHAVANAPIFSYDESFFGSAIVGGPLLIVADTSRLTAAAAVRVLNGEEAGDIKVSPVEFSAPRFDWRQMQRWGISEKTLPPGSEILFRDPTAWEQYRAYILAVTAAILIQATLIFWLLYEHWRRQRAEVQARDSLAELTHQNRAATAGELSAAIAHEVRQPITAMVIGADAALRWLSKESPDIGEAREAMNRVVATGHHASDVITNVRRLFGKDTQERIRTDINNLIRTILGLVYIDLRKHSIETQVNLSEQLPPVVGNEVQLQQVVLNLVMNAIESMVLAAEPRVLSIKSKSTEHNTVLVSIGDMGSGIDIANLNSIFKPMFTTKTRGMGMGLSICKSIIESHNGRIWVSANVPRGSVFHFELPVHRGGEGKSDGSDATLATFNGSPASAPSLADEITE